MIKENHFFTQCISDGDSLEIMDYTLLLGKSRLWRLILTKHCKMNIVLNLYFLSLGFNINNQPDKLVKCKPLGDNLCTWCSGKNALAHISANHGMCHHHQSGTVDSVDWMAHPIVVGIIQYVEGLNRAVRKRGRNSFIFSFYNE